MLKNQCQSGLPGGATEQANISWLWLVPELSHEPVPSAENMSVLWWFRIIPLGGTSSLPELIIWMIERPPTAFRLTG